MNTAVTSSQIETVAQNNISNIESQTVSSSTSSSPSFKATNVEQHIQKDYLDESSFLKQNNIGNRHRGGGKGKHLTRSHAMRESTSPPRTPTQRSTGNDIMLSTSPNTTLSPSTSSINFLQSNDEQQCLHVQSQISPSKSPTLTTDTTLLGTATLKNNISSVTIQLQQQQKVNNQKHHPQQKSALSHIFSSDCGGNVKQLDINFPKLSPPKSKTLFNNNHNRDINETLMKSLESGLTISQNQVNNKFKNINIDIATSSALSSLTLYDSVKCNNKNKKNNSIIIVQNDQHQFNTTTMGDANFNKNKNNSVDSSGNSHQIFFSNINKNQSTYFKKSTVTGHLQQHQNYEIIYDKENRCPSDDEKINHQNNCESPINLHNNLNDRCNNKKHSAGAKSTKPRLKTMGSSSSVEGCNNSSGFISRDNSTEQFTDQSGIDLIQFFKETLNKNDKDRCMLLRIENDLFCLIDDEKRDSMRFPPMSSYNRMLIHRTAAYFGMDHNLDPTQQSVVVTMSKLTRVPDIRFNSLINDLLEEPKKSILKRDTHSFDECRQGLLGCPERGLLDRKSKSFEEREEEYERARRRIFKGREQQLQLHQHHHQHLQQQEQEIGTNEIHWPWPSSESTETSSRLKAQNNRLLKVQSVCIDARPDGRPCVSKSHSFGGYGRHSCGQTGLSRDDSVTSTKSAGPRLFSKQDSTGSTNTPWRLSPSSSGYKTQSLRSDSVTPSPTGYGSGDHTPEPSILQSPTTTISSTSSINNNSYNINTNTLINESNVNVPQSSSTTTCGVVWAVTDMASVPRGSVLIDPQTLQPIVNQDGSLYHFDPLNLPSTNNMANKPPTILRKKTKVINNVNIIDANCSSAVNTEDYVINNNDNNNKNICNINNNSNNRINKDQTNETVSNDNINATSSTKIETNFINHDEKCYNIDDVNNNISNLNINDDENDNEDNNCCNNTKMNDINDESLNIKTKECEMKDIQEESSASPSLDNINEKSESEMQLNSNTISTINAQQKSQATSPKLPQMQSDLQNNEITNNLEKINKTEISNVSGNTNSYKVNNMTMTNNYNSQNTHQNYTPHNSTPHYSNSHHNYHINNHHYENSNVNNKKDDINNYKVAAIPVMGYTPGYPTLENGTVFPAGAANGTTYSAYQQGVDGNMYAIPQQMVYTYPQALDVEVPGYFLPMYDQTCNAGQTRDATTGAIISGAGSSGSATFHPSTVAAPTATVVAAPGSTTVLPITYPQSGYGNSPIYQGQVVYASDQFAAATTTPAQYPISYPLAYPFPYNGTTYQSYWGHPMTTYYVPQPQQLTSTVLSHAGVPSTVSAQAQNTTGILINQTPTNGITLNGTNNSGNGKRYTPPQHQHHHQQQIHQPQQSHSASSTPAATNATTFTPFSTGMHIPIAESPSSAAVAAATMYNSIPQPVYSNMLPYAGAPPNASAAGLIPHPIPHHQHGAMINQIIPSNLHTSASDPSIITSATTNGSHNSLTNNGGASNGTHNTATPQSTPSTPLSLPLPLPNQKNPPLFATPTILPNGFSTNLNGSTAHQNGGDVIVGFNNYERKHHPFALTRRNGNITLNRQLGYTPQNQHHFYNNQRKTSVTNSVETIVNRGNVTNNNQPHPTLKRNDLANASKQSQTAISTINTTHGSASIPTERTRGYRQKPANLDLRRSNTNTNNINNSNRNTPSTNSADSNNSPNSISSAGFDQQHHHQHIQMYMQRGTHIPPMHHSHATAIHDPTSHQQLITYNPAGMPAGGVYVKYGQQTYYTHPSMTTSALQNNRRSPPNDIRPTLTPITGVYPAVNMMLPGITTASHLPPSSNNAGWFLQQQLQRQQTNQIKKSTHITDLLYSNNLEDLQQNYNYNQYTIPPTAKYFYNHQYY